MAENTLENAAALWRTSGTPTDFIRAVESIPAGTDRGRVRELLGSPLLVSPAADGSESWLYVSSDPARGQFEALFVAFDANGRSLRLERKPIE